MKKIPLDISKMTRKLGYGERTHPARDWFILLTAAAILLATSVAWNVWLFTKAENGEVIGDEKTAEAFDTTLIERVHEVFEERKEEELRYRQEYRFVDPSL
jgi:hypothetical protein